MKTKRLDEMTWTDIKECLEQGVNTVVFGVGSTEQHGPSLPLQTDRRIADYVANLIATDLDNTLQAPTILVGYSGHHMCFPGSISLKESTLQAVVADYIESLVHHGFKNIVITNHHGGNCKAIEQCLVEMKPRFPEIKFVYFYDQDTTEAIGKLCHQFQLTPGQLGTHAGDMEASIMSYLVEHLVKPERFVKGFTGDYDEETKAKAFREGFISITENGVLGDQTRASKEKGAEYINALKNVVLRYIKRELL